MERLQDLCTVLGASLSGDGGLCAWVRVTRPAFDDHWRVFHLLVRPFFLLSSFFADSSYP